MKLLISSDWHLLAKRTANTTPKSRLRLKDALGQAISRIINSAPALECGRSVCVGDLYDTYKNEAGDLLDTVAPFMATDIILAGNHDLLAHADSISSLVFMDMLKHKFPFDPSEPVPKVIYGKLGEPHVEQVNLDGATLLFVPHVYTQALFEKSLDHAAVMASTMAGESPAPKTYLFLHCNIDSGFAEGSDIALNLTTERAKALLDAGISKIFCGHEHEPRDLLQGRLIIVGNTHPTSFADISSKRFLVLDTDTGEVESHQCYDAGAHYCAVDWLSCDVALEDPLPAGPETENVHWVRLTGTANASQVVDLAKLVRKIWDGLPNLMGLKVDVKIADLQLDPSAGQVSVADLKELVTRELQKQPDLLELWKEIAA